MKQRALFPYRPQNHQTRGAPVDRYAEVNRSSAEIILQDRKRYAGLPCLWAGAVLRGEPRAPAPPVARGFVA
jgi:hypothetical protein